MASRGLAPAGGGRGGRGTVRGRGSASERLQAEIKRRQLDGDMRQMLVLSAVLAERGTSLTDEEVTLASLQLLALIQRSNQIPVGLERAVPPLMAMVKEREDVGILGNILAALTALASRSHPPECDMSGEAFRLGAIEDIERLLERAAKMEAEGADNAWSLRTNATVFLHALVHTHEPSLEPTLASSALREVGRTLSRADIPSGLAVACCDMFAFLVARAGDPARVVAEELDVLGSVARVIAGEGTAADTELSVRALMVTGMLLPGANTTDEKKVANLRRVGNVEGFIPGLVQQCLGGDGDCGSIASSLLREMLKDEELRGAVEAALEQGNMRVADDAAAEAAGEGAEEAVDGAEKAVESLKLS